MSKRKSRFFKSAIIFVVIVAFLLSVLAFFVIGEKIAYGFKRYSPSYDKVNISNILTKNELSEADYELIYAQTGLTKIGVDSVLEAEGVYGVLDIQHSFFDEYTIKADNFAPFCYYYYLDKAVPIVPLQKGDIIVSSSTEFSYWSIGHCAMVVDVEQGLTVEAIGIGNNSTYGQITPLKRRGNFIVLRPSIDEEAINKIVDYVTENLIGIKYDPTIGVLSRKYDEDIEYTQCAHIFWYAFYKHGFDIDSNGGSVVTPKDLVSSEYFDVVQVSGFDPNTLWD